MTQHGYARYEYQCLFNTGAQYSRNKAIRDANIAEAEGSRDSNQLSNDFPFLVDARRMVNSLPSFYLHIDAL